VAHYIESSLGDNEHIIAKANLPWLFTLRAWLWLIFFGVLIVGIIIFIAMMIYKANLEIGVTSHRLVMKTGWLHLDTQEIALHNIEGVRMHQSFWGHLFGYGSLIVEGTGVDAVKLPPIANPVRFRAAIETAKESA
jgi:uncharacterized membrane protein YdbT with pleckstrin-like domain